VTRTARSRRFLHWLTLGLALSLPVRSLSAEPPRLATRQARLFWDDPERSRLSLTLSFRDVIDARIEEKLTRGLPTTIVLSAAVFLPGSERAVGTTVQSCRVTWHVWEEAYRVEIARPGNPTESRWTATTEGVLRRCAEARRLGVPLSQRLSAHAALVVRGRVLVNPVDEDLLQKITRWVSRPKNSSAPGDALFGAFTGIFLQRMGEAERVLVFETAPLVIESS